MIERTIITREAPESDPDVRICDWVFSIERDKEKVSSAFVGTIGPGSFISLGNAISKNIEAYAEKSGVPQPYLIKLFALGFLASTDLDFAG